MPDSPTDHDSRFSTLWASSYPRLRAYVFLFVGPQQDAEDVIQETALAAARDFAKFDTSRSFLEWVIGIARNRVKQHFQSKGRDRKLIFDPDAVASLEAAYRSKQGAFEDVRDGLDFCLQQLPPKSRKLIESRYLLCLSPEAIAQRLGTTKGTVYTRLSQVRVALKGCIERRLRLKERGN